LVINRFCPAKREAKKEAPKDLMATLVAYL